MTKQQIFVLVFTFIVGLAAGAYVYITSFAPQYGGKIAKSDSELIVIGEQFGGCERLGMCSHFRLESDGKYEYIKTNTERNSDPAIKTGKLGREQVKTLASNLGNTNLSNLQKTAKTCLSAADGIDYRYDILYAGVAYEFNSCGTAFYNSALYNELLVIWQELDGGTLNNGTSIEFDGVIPAFIDRFKSQ